jgi:transaldolase/glucose-6-phosphate isomerase
MARLEELADLGQSIWYDYIRRFFLTRGELKKLVEMGLRGVTSNPAIFEKAIAGSADYDDALLQSGLTEKSPEEIYEALAVEDIAMAADELRTVYEGTNGRDGYVSFEVSPELAHSTERTVSEGKRLFAAVARPNLMIKVPATEEGVPAIIELIGSGVNVNVTLLFGVANYLAVAEAFLAGLERLADRGPSVPGGHTVAGIASVASFFVSRVDTAVDQALEKGGNRELQGKIAIANAKIAYAEYGRIFRGARWERLAAQGARSQRLLWASTGTKNPQYSDTLYVDELIGPETVNTVPPATFEMFLDHGKAAMTLTVGIEEARAQVARLADLGIDLAAVTRKLQADGVAAFESAYRSLIESVQEKRNRLRSDTRSNGFALGNYQPMVDRALRELEDEDILNRIWKHDHTVWGEDPAEISNRLGWLHSPEVMVEAIPQILSFVDEVRGDGLDRALLLGMGGSSLAPEVFRKTFGIKEGYLDLEVLDSTDPGAVLEKKRAFDPAKSLFIVSTKSGGTVETISFMKYFYNRCVKTLGRERAGEHFVAITDTGSALERMAGELRFRRIFLNDSNIGGRYSVLSYFGLVPAALLGVDLGILLERASAVACNGEPCNSPTQGDNSSAALGTIMGKLAEAGRDKVTLICSPAISSYGAWVEQLIAESTGKRGKGILPVDGELLLKPRYYGKDRLFVYLRLKGDTTHDAGVEALKSDGHPVVRFDLRDLYDLGGEFFLWELATSIAGRFLGINPFDQPNVESAKVLARKMVAAFQKEGRLPGLTPVLEDMGVKVFYERDANDLKEALESFFALADQGLEESLGRSYVTLQAYVTPTPGVSAALTELRTLIQKRYRLATTVGYGPRFLHSTGQLHKGDGGNGLFIQITSDLQEDAEIPDRPAEDASSITFGILKDAQALGDRQALLDNRRRFMRLHLGGLETGLKALVDVLT